MNERPALVPPGWSLLGRQWWMWVGHPLPSALKLAPIQRNGKRVELSAQYDSETSPGVQTAVWLDILPH
jgi:hypothetical protein